MGLFGWQHGLGAFTQAGPSNHQALKIDSLGSCLAQAPAPGSEIRTEQPLYATRKINWQ